MRERVWEAANVKLEVVTIDTDTTVHTLYGQQMGGRKSYNPKNKGKKSYQPMLTFIAETREYVWGELRNGDRPTGKQIGDHIRNVCAALPPGVKQIYRPGRFGVLLPGSGRSLRRMQRPVRDLVRARRPGWSSNCAKPSGSRRRRRMPTRSANSVISRTGGEGIPVRGPALRENRARRRKPEETEQYQLFETSQYKYRVFVTDMSDPIYFVVWFYNQRGGAENLIKEANNDAGLAAHPSGRFDVNGNHFQLAMLAYNLNCWLMLFNREPQADATATAPHDSGDLAAALPVRGGQDLASRRPHWSELQRSLRGEGRVRAADGSAAPDRAARRRAMRR